MNVEAPSKDFDSAANLIPTEEPTAEIPEVTDAVEDEIQARRDTAEAAPEPVVPEAAAAATKAKESFEAVSAAKPESQAVTKLGDRLRTAADSYERFAKKVQGIKEIPSNLSKRASELMKRVGDKVDTVSAIMGAGSKNGGNYQIVDGKFQLTPPPIAVPKAEASVAKPVTPEAAIAPAAEAPVAEASVAPRESLTSKMFELISNKEHTEFFNRINEFAQKYHASDTQVENALASKLGASEARLYVQIRNLPDGASFLEDLNGLDLPDAIKDGMLQDQLRKRVNVPKPGGATSSRRESGQVNDAAKELDDAETVEEAPDATREHNAEMREALALQVSTAETNLSPADFLRAARERLAEIIRIDFKSGEQSFNNTIITADKGTSSIKHRYVIPEKLDQRVVRGLIENDAKVQVNIAELLQGRTIQDFEAELKKNYGAEAVVENKLTNVDGKPQTQLGTGDYIRVSYENKKLKVTFDDGMPGVSKRLQTDISFKEAA